ncbi:uncharacterized protein LOC119049804 [Artibeus jamaicensis]|uniref:uncharacterized protein LOC119049804 n=1 Tax=Artibeus jamaicensis TaxID=9417 RepID=UPI00235B2AA6|nr:uncharacterized protein LOC119049804 [Artibeus jamaicensis]
MHASQNSNNKKPPGASRAAPVPAAALLSKIKVARARDFKRKHVLRGKCGGSEGSGCQLAHPRPGWNRVAVHRRDKGNPQRGDNEGSSGGESDALSDLCTASFPSCDLRGKGPWIGRIYKKKLRWWRQRHLTGRPQQRKPAAPSEEALFPRKVSSPGRPDPCLPRRGQCSLWLPLSPQNCSEICSTDVYISDGAPYTVLTTPAGPSVSPDPEGKGFTGSDCIYLRLRPTVRIPQTCQLFALSPHPLCPAPHTSSHFHPSS